MVTTNIRFYFYFIMQSKLRVSLYYRDFVAQLIIYLNKIDISNMFSSIRRSDDHVIFFSISNKLFW
jgi:hypothetical protein